MNLFLNKFVVLLAVTCASFSCTQVDPASQPEPEEDALSIEFNQKSFSNKSAEFTLEVTANCDWTFSVDSDWAYVIEPKTTYNGSKTLAIVIKKNETTSERTTTFTFSYSKGKEELRISQAGFEVYLTVSEHYLSFGYRTAEKIITILSNCGWEAKSSEDWVAIRPITGLVGNFEMTVNVETNNTKDSRNAIIEIWNRQYSLLETVNVVQSGQEKINDKDYIDEYGINWGKGILIRGLSWAPVNYGYHPADFPYGKMFQWGRKFGISYHDGTYNDSIETPIEELWTGFNGAEDPTSFYKYGETSKYGYDWIKEGDDTFWNKGSEENPIKNAQFDPCPEGWRIPTAFEFKSLIDYVDWQWCEVEGIKGYQLSQNIEESDMDESEKLFLPAAGRLNTIDGLSYDRNIEGYYWTITVDAGNSGYLFFYNEGFSVNYKGSRAGGCSVRCLKE